MLYGASVSYRLFHILIEHEATDYVYSDMQSYIETGIRFFSENPHLVIGDSIYPPGTALLFGTFTALDPTLSLIMVVQFVIASLIPIFLWIIGKKLFGNATGIWALVLGSIHYPFIDYAAYFLSENPFTFFLLSAFLCLVMAIQNEMRIKVLSWGIAGGLMLGISMALRSVVLLPAVVTAGVLLACFPPHIGWKRVVWVLGSAGAGFIAILIPLSIWCTHIAGYFCLASTNGALGILQGHFGSVGHFHFNDTVRGFRYEFGSPATLQKGYEGVAEFPFGPYDRADVLDAAWGWISAYPMAALRESFAHVYDLFWGTILWPSSYTDDRSRMIVSGWIWLIVMFTPAVCILARPAVWRDARVRALTLLTLAPLVGIMLVAFITVGDPRYRVPFDGFIIILAAHFYASMPSALRSFAYYLIRNTQ